MTLAFLRRLEDALASVIDGGLARLDGGGVHPLEIAQRLQREMAEGRLLGMDVPYAPNRYTDRLGEDELEHLGELTPENSQQIARHLEEYAEREGWAIGDGVRVRIESGGREGRIEVTHAMEEDAPGATLQVVAGQADRGSFEVAERALIGREAVCDVTLEDLAVSRRHAEIEWTYQGYVIRDLGSSNGTFVNTTELDETLLADGDLIEVGLVQLRFRRPG